MLKRFNNLKWMKSFCKRSYLIVVPIYIIAAWVLFFSFFGCAHAASGINQQLNYQGKITNSSSTDMAGSFNFKFELYNDPTAGDLLWSETWDDSSNQVVITNGVFSVALGSISDMDGSIFNNDNLYLQVYFDADSDGVFEEIFSPRKRLTSAPYAFNARALGGYLPTITSTPNSIPVLDSAGGLTISGVTTTVDIYANSNITVTGTSTFNGASIFNGAVSGPGFTNAWDLAFNSTSTWWAFGDSFDTNLAGKTTDDLTDEGAVNKYYATSLFLNDFTNPLVASTTGLAEGTNLYYTIARASTTAVNAVLENLRGKADGVASLNSSGKIPISELSSVVIGNTYIASTTDDMILLYNTYSLSVGDVAVVTASGTTFILQELDGSSISDWVELNSPVAAIRQINGQFAINGVLTLTADHINEGLELKNLYFTNARADARISL